MLLLELLVERGGRRSCGDEIGRRMMELDGCAGGAVHATLSWRELRAGGVLDSTCI